MKRTLIICAITVLFLIAGNLFAGPTLGVQNLITTPYHTGLYGTFAAGDTTFGDDSKLQNIILTKTSTWENIKALGGFHNPHQNPHLYECPSHNYSLSYQETTSYSKSYSETESTTVTSSLSAEFKGIGASLEGSHTSSTTIGEEKQDSTTLQKTSEAFSLGPGGTAEFYLKEFYVKYEGTFDWFYDDTSIIASGTYHYDVPWSITVHYKNLLMGPYITGVTPCPPVPVPGAFLLGGLGTVCVGWMKRRRTL